MRRRWGDSPGGTCHVRCVHGGTGWGRVSGLMPEEEPRVALLDIPAERADRKLVELLQELRVVQTGVQIVFAFLLGIAFTSRFPGLSDFQTDMYISTLLLTVVASVLLATPVALRSSCRTVRPER